MTQTQRIGLTLLIVWLYLSRTGQEDGWHFAAAVACALLGGIFLCGASD